MKNQNPGLCGPLAQSKWNTLCPSTF